MTDEAVVSGATKDDYIKSMADLFRQEYPTGSVPMSVILTPNEIKAFPGIDKDGNGELNFAEFMELAGQSFDRYDQHPRDGILTKEEIERGHRESNEPKEESLWSKHTGLWIVLIVLIVLWVVVLGSFAGVAFFSMKKSRAKKVKQAI